jgi:glycosyltransferase involved in cell wall biosynthesis
MRDCLNHAALNFYFTERDRIGLAAIIDAARLAPLEPFTDLPATLPQPKPESSGTTRLITIAMMREGVKFESFRLLAASLSLLKDLPWHLTVIGDGPRRAEVQNLFREIPTDHVTWTGAVDSQDLPRMLNGADIFVWPGCGEAYGMAYLEAQAAGLPVIAMDTAGVPSVVRDGETGRLVPKDDVQGFAAAIRNWVRDPRDRHRFGERARNFVMTARSLEQAAARLDLYLQRLIRK